MVGILIASHGGLADGLLDGIELVLGKQEQLITLGLRHGDGFEEFEEKVKTALEKLDTGDGVIAFVDILGGTPSNVIFRCLANKKFKAIAGVNMPMVVQAVSMRPILGEEELYQSVLEVANRPPTLLHEMAEAIMENSLEEDEI
ncbi:MAG: PTS sugar transporter subunit IIA [Clostridiales bacterium]|nr:PTS sugar transporter subunit IIA [Clostridiales bacterium]